MCLLWEYTDSMNLNLLQNSNLYSIIIYTFKFKTTTLLTSSSFCISHCIQQHVPMFIIGASDISFFEDPELGWSVLGLFLQLPLKLIYKFGLLFCYYKHPSLPYKQITKAFPLIVISYHTSQNSVIILLFIQSLNTFLNYLCLKNVKIVCIATTTRWSDVWNNLNLLSCFGYGFLRVESACEV